MDLEGFPTRPRATLRDRWPPLGGTGVDSSQRGRVWTRDQTSSSCRPRPPYLATGVEPDQPGPGLDSLFPLPRVAEGGTAIAGHQRHRPAAGRSRKAAGLVKPTAPSSSVPLTPRRGAAWNRGSTSSSARGDSPRGRFPWNGSRPPVTPGRAKKTSPQE